ncbi:IS3 family transposase [Actinacidiphila glaucinigra]|uniref:IS3 family transposase n=1 Tax=Actinacidiphila glaucinigra TaxID=235986 RepID=UPI003712A2AE
MAGEGLPIRTATRVLGISESGYFTWRGRPPSARSTRHQWLTDLIAAIHSASRGTFGYRRIHEELTLRHGVTVSHGTVELLMRRAGLQGRPGVPDRLWVTDAVELATRQGRLLCVIVLDAHARRLMGWSTGSAPAAAVAADALSRAVLRQSVHPGPRPEGRFTTLVFTERAHARGLAPPTGLVADRNDHAVIGAFWARARTELLDHREWHSRLDLTTALSDYFEGIRA